jgi:hypothetical protein
MRDRSEQAEAVRMGLRRAGLHWIRAGYEVIAGLGAFLDEVNRARHESGEAAPDTASRPERIEIE